MVVAVIEPDSLGRLLADGALVALAANLGNLLDRAPGRTTKVALVAFVVLVLGAGRRARAGRRGAGGGGRGRGCCPPTWPSA